MSVLSPNMRERQAAAMYRLELREAGGKLVSVPGNAVAGIDGVFRFATNPQSMSPSHPTRATIMDATGDKNGTGIGIADVQGIGRPSFEISGQFLQAPVSAGAGLRALDNWQYQRALEHFVRYYFFVNRERAEARRPLVRMIWRDFYREEHWVVVPRNVPAGRLVANQPTAETYSLKLEAVERADAPKPPANKAKAALKPENATDVCVAACLHLDHGPRYAA